LLVMLTITSGSSLIAAFAPRRGNIGIKREDWHLPRNPLLTLSPNYGKIIPITVKNGKNQEDLSDKKYLLAKPNCSTFVFIRLKCQCNAKGAFL